MWGKKAIEAYIFLKEATLLNILNFFPKGTKTTNNYTILHIVVSFYPKYMSTRLGRIEGFGQNRRIHSFPPCESLRDIYIHETEPNKTKHPFLISKTCSWNPNAQSSGYLGLPPCGLNLQTQISCYNHFLTSHMEDKTKKVNCIKCLQKKSSGEQIFPVGVTLRKEEVDTSVQRGLIPTDHISLWQQEQNRESTCTEPWNAHWPQLTNAPDPVRVLESKHPD